MKAFNPEQVELLNEMFGIIEKVEEEVDFETAFEDKYGYLPDESDYRISQQIEDFKETYKRQYKN